MVNKKNNKITSSDNKEFLKSLKNAKDESDVEQAYKRIFQKRYIDNTQNATMNRPYGSDGFLRSGEIVLVLRMLMEFKKGVSLTNITSRARIIAQVIYYLKKFELAGEELPNVIFSGDEDEMFVVYAPVLYRYLSENYDWSIAPNEAPFKNLELLEKLTDDPNLSSFVFNINVQRFNINEVLDAIDSLVSNNGMIYKIKVNEANVRIVFEEFIRMIFSNDRKIKMGLDPKKNPQLLVSIFIQSILGVKELYPVPTKRNTLHLPDGSEIRLDTIAFSAFFSRYERRYTVEEKDILISIADQLIEETSRRFSGDFWTPTVWANRANQIIDEVVGENWRNDYVVWDPACGTKNLSRDFQFKRLYSSTLHQEELDMSIQYNKDSIYFQYDFLNDDINVNPESNIHDLKMPAQLFHDLKEDKPIIFFANPPYATANDAGAKGTSKKTVAQTKLNEIMKQNKVGSSSQQLYAQFFYRVLKLKKDFNLSNVYIAFFSKTQFLTGGKYWEGFEKELFSNFQFEKGILFNAGEFTDVSNMWPVTFGIYKSRKEIEENFNKEFKYNVESLTENGIEKIGEKTIYIINQSEFLSEWVREPNNLRKDFKELPYPQFSSAFNINEAKGCRGRMLSNAFGYMVSVGNNIYNSKRDVFLFSGSAYKANGLSVTPENFERVVVTFASRKSVRHSWINDMDNFKKPNLINNPDGWKEFVNDCMIYSLFHTGASYQTSLTNVEYQNNYYDIENEWFFVSYKDIKKLAQEHYVNEIEEQLRFVKKERYVYEQIINLNLSKEAQSVYDEAVQLLKISFKYRQLANQEHPEWNVTNWDAGFYQIYKITEKYKTGELDLFKNAFKKLEEKIEKNVYLYGMLRT